jgi:hypothetical protein
MTEFEASALVGASIEVFQPGVDGIVHGTLPAGRNGLIERAAQCWDVVGERRVGGKRNRDVFVEAEDENLVLRIAGLGKRHGCGNHPVAIVAHASAAVDHEADGDRGVLVAEETDRLRLFVLEDMKRALLETADVTLLVAYSDVKDDDLRF